MRITLLHNPSAGSGSPTRAELENWLLELGHEVYYASADDDEPARLLSRPADLVVAAGGDGTAATAMRELAGRDTPVAILPLGTANNIANSLGVHGSPPALIRQLASARPRLVDVPHASSPWGTSCFVESAGVGLFARVLRDAQREEYAERVDTGQQDLRSGRGERMRRVLADQQPASRMFEVDGVPISTECLFLAVFNTPAIGPRLGLAPDADPGDGLLDLLLITERERQAMNDYLAAVDDDPAAHFSVPTRKCRTVILRWDLSSGHVDDEPWPEPAAVAADATDGIVRIEVGASNVTVLVPAVQASPRS
jgi:diacylglycerol kinase family enzyme